MDYEKAYKKALTHAREIHRNECEKRRDMEWLFPELKESDDEKVRKALVEMVHDTTGDELWVDYNVHKEEALAWLEKQDNTPKEVTCTQEVEVGNGSIKALVTEKIPVDKVEPKFKVGDWCIDSEDGTIFQIVKVLDNTYTYKTNEGKEYSCTHYSLENDAKLWSIQDAKEGDVVVDKSDGTIGIFQSIGHHPDGGSYNNPSYCFLHCRYDDGFFYADFEHGNTIDSDDLIPATKEQRDLLFSKMHEAGYDWDDEKKELKLLITNGDDFESENYDGEDYGIDSLFHAKRILEKTLGKVDGYQTDDGILEHKCAIAVVNKLYKQKPAWSEDETSIAIKNPDAYKIGFADGEAHAKEEMQSS